MGDRAVNHFDMMTHRVTGAHPGPVDPRAERLIGLAREIGRLYRNDGETVHSVEIIVMRDAKRELASAVAILPHVVAS